MGPGRKRKGEHEKNYKSQITNYKYFPFWKLEIGNWKLERKRLIWQDIQDQKTDNQDQLDLIFLEKEQN